MTGAGNKPRAAAYCRVSTEKEEQLMSLENQKAFFKTHVEKIGYELTEVYADEGLTGTRLKNRHAFQRMMRDAAEGKFSHVFVKDVSRLARNVVDFLQSVRKLRTLGVECQFITSGMSLADGELTLTILAAVAQEESANLSSRVKFGKRKNAERGRVPNMVYGYDKIPGDYFSLRVNAREAEIVRQMFDWYVSGAYGTGRIAAMLNEKGEKTKRGCAFTQAGVRRILSNRIYIGQIINGRETVSDFLTGARETQAQDSWFICDRAELAIIDNEVFLQAQEMLAGREEAFGGHKRHRQHLFSGLIRCTCCGQSFRRLVRKTKQGATAKWVCSGRNLKGAGYCANTTTIAEQALHNEIAAYLAEQADGGLIQAVQREVSKLAQGDKGMRRQDMQQELSRLARAKKRQMELFEKEATTLAEFKERMNQLREEEARLQKQMQACEPAAERRIDIHTLFSQDALDSVLLHQLIEEISVEPAGRVQVKLRTGH